MWFLELFAVAYLIVVILAVVMALAAIDSKPVRLTFIVLGLVMPFIFLYSAAASLFSPRTLPRFNEGMAKTEDDIETERMRLFGGERTCPSFGHRWERAYQAYIEKLVQKAAKTSERIAFWRLDSALGAPNRPNTLL